MNKQTVTAAHSVFSNKGAFALFLGSGISRSSGIPTGWEITLELINRIATIRKEKIDKSPEEWYLQTFNQEPDYSEIIQQLTLTSEERVNLLRPFIEPSENDIEEGLKVPTSAHDYIAKLVKNGYIKVIVTTNFDRLIENALKNNGIEPTVISNPNHVDNVLPIVHSKITVIKINGDYLDTGFLNLKSELEKYDSRLEKLMVDVFENFGIISCGWSAKWDLALVNIFKSSNKFRFSSYFTFLSFAGKELEELSTFRKGNLLKIENSDSFFYELYEDIIALERYGSEHILSPKISLERAKKYVATEENIIQLHDLISNISNETFQMLNETPFGNIDEELIRAKLDWYEKRLEILSLILAECVYWGKGYHDNIWLDVLKKTGDVNHDKAGNNFVIWNTIQYLPSLLIRYIIGIAAVASKKYYLLRAIFNIEFFEARRTVGILEKTDPWDFRNSLTGNVLMKNHETPMSQFLYNFTRPFFRGIISVEKEFERVFDYHEFICSLYYESNKMKGYIGLFGHRNHKYISSILEKAKVENNEFELCEAGLFSDYGEFERVSVKFIETISNSNLRWKIY